MIKIFVVEDDEGIRELVQFLLEGQGYSVQAFPTAGSFEKFITNNLPDLYLLDIMLPDGNGLDLCSNLKKNQHTRNIPVILMSAHYNVENTHGADDFLSKPFDIDNLLNRIENQLNIK